jgi:hypothetical protein
MFSSKPNSDVSGMAGLADLKRPGRPRTVDQSKIITETLTRRRGTWG